MGQLGTILLFLLPVAVKAGRSSLWAIPLAGGLSVLVAVARKGRKSNWYNLIRKILAAAFGLLLWYRLSMLLSGYLAREDYWPLAGAVLILLLVLGRKGMGRPEGLKGLWSKAVGVLLFLLLVFQIPNLDLPYVFQGSGLKTTDVIPLAENKETGVFAETLLLFAGNIPFFLELGKSEEGSSSCLWKKQLGLWSLFWILFVVLAATYRFPLLVRSDQVFLNLGRSGVWMEKIPVRLEIPADLVLWVTVFFALWECAAVWEEPFHSGERSYRSRGRGPGLGVLALAMALLTGCSQRLAEKEIVLVADTEALLQEKEQPDPKSTEYSHLKLLVIHEQVEEKLIEELLNRNEISFQTRVAFSEEDLSEDITREKETLTDQMRHYRFAHTVTVLELLNACYSPGKVLYLPQIEVKDGEIKENAAVVFKGDTMRVSFQ